jgi:hypothetical protein
MPNIDWLLDAEHEMVPIRRTFTAAKRLYIAEQIEAGTVWINEVLARRYADLVRKRNQ